MCMAHEAVAKAASCPGANDLGTRALLGNPFCANYAAFVPFLSVLPFCNVLELEMNSLYFVLSSKAF